MGILPDASKGKSLYWYISASPIPLLYAAYLGIKLLRGFSPSKKRLAELDLGISGQLVNLLGFLGIFYPLVLLLTFLPLGVIYSVSLLIACIPGLLIMYRINDKLERSGTDQVQPVMEWLNKGKLLGWGVTMLILILCLMSLTSTLAGSGFSF